MYEECKATTLTDPVLIAIEAHRSAWATYRAVESQLEAKRRRDVTATEFEAIDRAYAAACYATEALWRTRPTTLAGCKAAISYIVGRTGGSLLDDSGEFLRSLLRSPLLASIA